MNHRLYHPECRSLCHEDGDKDILAGITMDGNTRFRMPSLKGEAREPSWSPIIDDRK